MSSAGNSSDYIKTTSRNRYDTDKHASGAHEPGSVTSGPLRKAPSYIEEIKIERMEEGSRPPMQMPKR